MVPDLDSPGKIELVRSQEVGTGKEIKVMTWRQTWQTTSEHLLLCKPYRVALSPLWVDGIYHHKFSNLSWTTGFFTCRVFSATRKIQMLGREELLTRASGLRLQYLSYGWHLQMEPGDLELQFISRCWRLILLDKMTALAVDFMTLYLVEVSTHSKPCTPPDSPSQLWEFPNTELATSY